MTTISSASTMDDQGPDRETGADNTSPPRFTAVNGRDPMVQGPAVTTTSFDNEERQEPVEGLSIRSRYNTPPRHEGSIRDNGNFENGRENRQSQRPSSQSEVSVANSNRGKRKRSESNEEGSSHSPHRVPKSLVPHVDECRDTYSQPPTSNGVTISHSDHEPKYISNRSPSVLPRAEDIDIPRNAQTATSWQEYDSQLVNQVQRAQQFDSSDAQLAEALQRDAQGPDAGPKNWATANRSAEDTAQIDQSSSLPSFTQERPQAIVQVAPKRKRVFSNRTKTGCMTCRRRKKKCDEQHPACNNCIRGGFTCEGYSSRSTWQKPSSSKTPVPLQSKEGYADVAGPYPPELSQPQLYDRQQALTELEPGKIRPIAVDDGDRATAQFSASPTGTGSSRESWSKRSWPSAGHPAYIPNHLAKPEFREVPSIHDLSRDGHPKADYQMVPPIRELAHGKPGVPFFQGSMDQRQPNASAVDTSSPQAQARMALSIENQLSGRTVSNEETEKDKMVRGELYRPFDVVLVEERERCKAALWRFNNGCNPVYGVSTKEQSRLLKEVLIPPNSIVNSPSGVGSPRPAGSIGQGAVIEAPFRCNYGYNLCIGEDAMICEGCLFIDDCPITIGAHTWIGPRVTILSAMAHANMQERKGSQSRYQGRPVTIEEDCYVGAGSTIYPGVRLRRGAYIAPGEVVKSDIVAYGFQGLKPTYM